MPDDPVTELRGHLRVVRNELLSVRAMLREMERRVDAMLEVVDRALYFVPAATGGASTIT